MDLRASLHLCNSGRFFDAHEALEDLWRELPRTDPARKHLQGLVQLAVAFHHESRGNLRGAKSVLHRAMRNLAGSDASFPDLDLGRLRRDMAGWQSYLADRTSRPTAPKILPRTPEL